jgi:hypothetical protein
MKTFARPGRRDPVRHRTGRMGLLLLFTVAVLSSNALLCISGGLRCNAVIGIGLPCSPWACLSGDTRGSRADSFLGTDICTCFGFLRDCSCASGGLYCMVLCFGGRLNLLRRRISNHILSRLLFSQQGLADCRCGCADR